MDLIIAADDPRADDVRALLERHLAFARAASPPEHVHALDIERLLDPAITFFSARRDGALLAIAALKHLDRLHAEVKSMHTAEAARGHGLGRAMVEHVVTEARRRGCRRLSLETGAMDAFAPSRRLYARVGFVPCEPFAEHTANPYSMCMTLDLASVC